MSAPKWIVRKLPERLLPLLGWDFLPWGLVSERHGDDPRPLVALFEAWDWLSGQLDLPALADQELPADSGGCARCGTCCAHRRPGPVSASTVRRWKARGTPVVRFYEPAVIPGRGPSWDCWFFDGVRLRLCPLLLVNRRDGKPFCAIHQLGKTCRPPRCSGFEPHPPGCQRGYEGLVI